MKRLRQHLAEPVDAAGVAAFRLFFGTILAINALRFVAQGWLEPLFVEPAFFFKYPGFEWVAVPGPVGLYTLYALITLSAAGIATGVFYRPSIALFIVSFGYAQLLDVTNYLNHYLLVLLLAALLLVIPADRALSPHTRRLSPEAQSIPRLGLWLLRTQFALVYFFAAVAKMNADWLFEGQPMITWMNARDELPILGPLLGTTAFPHAMAWAGLLYDLLIPALLLWPKTRRLAFITVLTFHGMTSLLFDIGIFPILMTAGATLFFTPSWPRTILHPFKSGGDNYTQFTLWRGQPQRRLLQHWELAIGRAGSALFDRRRASEVLFDRKTTRGRIGTQASERGHRRLLEGPRACLGEGPGAEERNSERQGYSAISRHLLPIPILATATLWLALNIFIPARGLLLFTGPINWHEQGMRFAWRVMTREKNGSVSYRVYSPTREKTWRVSNHDYLTLRQANEMSGQPDLILQLAKHIGAEFQRRGIDDVEVYAHTAVSMNGRAPRPLIDSQVDLLKQSWSFWRPLPWILAEHPSPKRQLAQAKAP